MNQEELPTSPYILYCPTCKQRLHHKEDFFGIKSYECSDTHVSVQWFDEKIIGYTIFWDADTAGEERYKLIANNNQTRLFIKTKVRINAHNKHWDAPRDEVYWKAIMDMDHLLQLNIKDKVIIVNNIIPRLKLLKAFT